MLDLNSRRLPFLAVAALGCFLIGVSAFLPWFVEPDGSGPNAFALPLSILFGSVENAFAGAGPISIGYVLLAFGILGLLTLPVRRVQLVGTAVGLLALMCATDYALQMLRSSDFQSFVYQTFGLSIPMAMLGGLLMIAGTSFAEFRRR